MADEPITKSIQTQRGGRILSWLTFLADGAPDIRFFRRNKKLDQIKG